LLKCPSWVLPGRTSFEARPSHSVQKSQSSQNKQLNTQLSDTTKTRIVVQPVGLRNHFRPFVSPPWNFVMWPPFAVWPVSVLRHTAAVWLVSLFSQTHISLFTR